MKSQTSKNLFTTSYPQLDNILGVFDQLAIHVVAGDAIVGGTQPLMLSAQIQHSADGINWIDKRTAAEVPPQNVLNGSSATPTTVVLSPGYDDGTTPSLAFVRLRFNLTTSGVGSASPMSAKIKTWVTCNDLNEARFVQHDRQRWLEHVARARAAHERAQKEHQREVEDRAKLARCVAAYRKVGALGKDFEEMKIELRNACVKDGVSIDAMMAAVEAANHAEKEERAATKRRNDKIVDRINRDLDSVLHHGKKKGRE